MCITYSYNINHTMSLFMVVLRTPMQFQSRHIHQNHSRARLCHQVECRLLTKKISVRRWMLLYNLWKTYPRDCHKLMYLMKTRCFLHRLLPYWGNSIPTKKLWQSFVYNKCWWTSSQQTMPCILSHLVATGKITEQPKKNRKTSWCTLYNSINNTYVYL